MFELAGCCADGMCICAVQGVLVQPAGMINIVRASVVKSYGMRGLCACDAPGALSLCCRLVHHVLVVEVLHGATM